MDGYELYVVRSGCFAYRTTGVSLLADATVCLLGGPGHQADVGHPTTGGDTGTAVLFPASVIADVAGGCVELPPAAPATLAVRVAHWRLLRGWSQRHGTHDVEERGIELFSTVLSTVQPSRVAAGAPAAATRVRLCDDARAALATHHRSSSLVEVARLVGCSPYHLSRIFREQTGLTFSQYKRCLRLSEAVDLILDGETPLARVATECGFADHAHLTRTLKTVHHTTPTELRRITALGAVASA